jgi:glycosyltransferase involved in cell wall biosynthesis
VPSHQENFGIAVAEALACATPVLISDQVNIWREVQDTDAGLVAPDDLAGTTLSLARWIALPSEERTRMRRNAEACYSRFFSIEGSGASLLKALESHGLVSLAAEPFAARSA